MTWYCQYVIHAFICLSMHTHVCQQFSFDPYIHIVLFINDLISICMHARVHVHTCNTNALYFIIIIVLLYYCSTCLTLPCHALRCVALHCLVLHCIGLHWHGFDHAYVLLLDLVVVNGTPNKSARYVYVWLLKEASHFGLWKNRHQLSNIYQLGSNTCTRW
jgi:hypothetical protein